LVDDKVARVGGAVELVALGVLAADDDAARGPQVIERQRREVLGSDPVRVELYGAALAECVGAERSTRAHLGEHVVEHVLRHGIARDARVPPVGHERAAAVDLRAVVVHVEAVARQQAALLGPVLEAVLVERLPHVAASDLEARQEHLLVVRHAGREQRVDLHAAEARQQRANAARIGRQQRRIIAHQEHMVQQEPLRLFDRDLVDEAAAAAAGHRDMRARRCDRREASKQTSEGTKDEETRRVKCFAEEIRERRGILVPRVAW